MVTVPNTFIATTEAITQAGALPIFVDIDARTCNMDPEALARFLSTECSWSGRKGDRPIHLDSGKTVSAIVPVHLYGQPADMDSLQTLADKYNILVLEDACQAHGARYFSGKRNMWRIAGSMSTAAAFSFYPGKNLGALGEAGAVTTDDPEIAATVRLLREHGSIKKYYHTIEGYNGRMDAIQAGFLKVKLPFLKEGNHRRRQCANYYDKRLAGLPGLVTPFEPDKVIGNFHLYVIHAQRRDDLQLHLSDQGIATGRHYPVPLHLQVAYQHLGYGKNAFPVAEETSLLGLSLPMYPSLSLADLDRVIEAIYSFYGSRGSYADEAMSLSGEAAT